MVAAGLVLVMGPRCSRAARPRAPGAVRPKGALSKRAASSWLRLAED